MRSKIKRLNQDRISTGRGKKLGPITQSTGSPVPFTDAQPQETCKELCLLEICNLFSPMSLSVWFSWNFLEISEEHSQQNTLRIKLSLRHLF